MVDIKHSLDVDSPPIVDGVLSHPLPYRVCLHPYYYPIPLPFAAQLQPKWPVSLFTLP